MPRALVIGGGVAGPAAAQLLARDGWDTHVYEAHAEPDPFAGLFLNVATNGLAVLETLGLRDRLLTDGHRAGRMVMWSRTGKELGTVPNGRRASPSAAASSCAAAGCTRCCARGPTRRASRRRTARGWCRSTRTPTACAPRSRTGRSRRATSSSAPTASAPRRGGTSTRAPPSRRTAVWSGSAGSRACPGWSRHPRRSTSCSAPARSSATSCAPTAPPTGSPTSPRPTGTRAVTLDDLRGAALRRPVPRASDPGGDHRRAPPVPDRRPRRGAALEPRAGRRARATRCTPPARAPGRARRSRWRTRPPWLVRCGSRRRSRTAFAAYQAARQPRTDAVVKYARAINAQKRVTKSRLGVAIRDAMMPMFLRKAANDTRNDWLYNHTVG